MKTIKKRLATSNLLMVAIPVAAAVISGLIILAVLLAISGSNWFTFREEHFYDNKEAIAEQVVLRMSEEQTDGLDEFIRDAGIANVRIFILDGSTVFYDGGTAQSSDRQLLSSVYSEGAIFLSDGQRQLYSFTEGSYRVNIFCDYSRMSGTPMLIAAIVAIAAFIAVVAASIIIADRVLSRMVFRAIITPLDKLQEGAEKVAAGDLSFRIDYDGRDEFSPVIEQFNDMTEKLRQSQILIKENEANRSLLVAGITHDIKSPLTSIIGYVEGLCDGVADTSEKRARYTDVIRRKCGEISALVNRMIVLTEKNFDAADHNGRISLDGALRRFVLMRADDYAAAGLDISYEGETDVKLNMGEDDCMRIAANIADNALKYRRGERGKLDITLREDDGAAVLSFADEGCGVPDETLPKLFDPFFRTDAARTSTADGNGLGLAIIKKAITCSGGEIKAFNNDRGGLTVEARWKKYL